MPRVRKKNLLRKKGLTRAHLVQLCIGHDFFLDGFGRGPEANESMHLAWQTKGVKEKVYKVLKERQAQGQSERRIPWAEEMFGKTDCPPQ